jgi:hypothetical protein
MTYKEKLHQLEKAVQEKVDEASRLSDKFVASSGGGESSFDMSIMAKRNSVLEQAINTLTEFNDLIVRMKNDKIDPGTEYIEK